MVSNKYAKASLVGDRERLINPNWVSFRTKKIPISRKYLLQNGKD